MILATAYVAAMNALLEVSRIESTADAADRDNVYAALHVGLLAAAAVVGFLVGKWLNGLGLAYATLFVLALSVMMVGAQLTTYELACHGHNDIMRHWQCEPDDQLLAATDEVENLAEFSDYSKRGCVSRLFLSKLMGQHRPHAHCLRPADIFAHAVTHEQSVLGRHSQSTKSRLVHRRVRLAVAHGHRVDGHVRILSQREVRQPRIHQRRHRNGVRNEAHSEPARPQSVEKLVASSGLASG